MKLFEVESRVTAGAAWLDWKVPGWVERISLTLLNIDSPYTCVLGQTFEGESSGNSGYYFALDKLLGNDEYVAMDLGFNALEGEYEDRVAEMPVLTEAWRRLVMARRAELALAA